MTSEQLQSARAERWRQTANPIVTADDARAWVEGVGLCLFLPRRAHFSVPAPSFVEAVAGTPSDSTPANKDHSLGTPDVHPITRTPRVLGTPDAPSREAIEQATGLLHRLTAEGAVVPLNLFHAASYGVGAPAFGGADQPDFVATRETMPYVFSLIGGRNWKSGPGDKASPLMKEIWALLEGEGALRAQEIQAALGRELTETAVLRGLLELWGGLRVIPVYDGETTRWELTQARFAVEMTASQKVAQSTALSALVSFYLQAAIAASSEEVETFLSPLASRSRVREVVNGLQATRQLGLISVNAQPLVHVAGSLPEFEEEEPRKVERKPPSFEKREAYGAREFREETRKSVDRGPREERAGRKGFERREERGERRPYPHSGEDRVRTQRRPFEKERRTEGRESGSGDRERGNFGKKRFDSGSRGFERRNRFGKERGRDRRERTEFRGREERGERREFRGGKFPPKKFGKRDGERPWQERGEQRGYQKPAGHREEGGRKFWERDRKPSGDRGENRREDKRGGERRQGGFGERGQGRFGKKKFGAEKFGGGKKFAGPKKPGEKRFEGEKRFGGPKKFGSRGPSKEFEREKRPFYSERGSEGGGERRAERTSRAESRAGARFERRGERGPRQGKPEFRGTGKSKFGGKKFGERGAGNAGFKKGGFGKSGKPFGKAGKSHFGGRKQSGGFRPPFRKRKDKESESGE